MNIEIFLSRLAKVRKSGDAYMACCPAHEDTEPSLRIADGGDKVLLCCYAGCSALDVLTAIGLDWTDAFEATVERKRDYQPRLTERDLRGFAHSLDKEILNVRHEEQAVDDKQKQLVEQSRVRLMRFAEKYGAIALQRVIAINNEINEVAA